MKKYKMTNETKQYLCMILHRIVCVTAFDDVKAGDLGGWIENESNLSQDGNAWVYADAIVCDNATVSGNAKVSGYSEVYGNAKVCDNAVVCFYARVYENAVVCDNAEVNGYSLVHDNTKVSGNTVVKERLGARQGKW